MTLHKLTPKLILATLFIIGLSFQSNAQFYEIADYVKRASTAREHINQLHDGTLVIRLRSKSNNIKAMKKALASPKLSKKQRKRLTKQLNTMIDETTKENSAIVYAVKQHYSFSEYRIVRDTSMRMLFAKKEKGYFLNEDLEIADDLSIDFSNPVYILKYGPAKVSENTRREGFIITDFERNELESPFPYLTKTMRSPFAVLSFFVGDSRSTPKYNKMIQRTNEALNKFFIVSQIKSEKDKLRKQIKDLKDD